MSQVWTAIVSSDETIDCVHVAVQGPPGPGSDKTYTHNQLAPLAVWTITHNLGKFPSVTIVDSAGTVVYGDITHLNSNECTATFSVPFSGRAYCN